MNALLVEKNLEHHRSRYLVIANKTGQVGNRLVLYAHMLGAAMERGWSLFNPSFVEYADFFIGTHGRLATCGAELTNPRTINRAERQALFRVNRIGYQCSKVLGKIPHSGVGWAKAVEVLHYDLGELLDRADARHWRILFTQNYHFRQHDWCAKHAAAIRALLTPREPWRSQADGVVVDARQAGEVLVGVHIRHGDYLHHLGGKFFYEVPAYAALMRRMVELLAPQRVVFLVCSNARHQPSDFAGMTVRFGPGHLISDLHALSGCDWLFGPPSSFSAWAAFYGSVRYHMVEDPTQTLQADDFAVPRSPDPRY